MEDQEKKPTVIKKKTAAKQAPGKVEAVKFQTLNIHQRIAQIKRVVSFVQKTETVKGFGETYTVVTHDMVTAKTHDPLVDYGVNFYQRMLPDTVLMREVGKTKTGRSIFRLECFIEMRLACVDRPDDDIKIPWYVHAEDFADKAPGKAYSLGAKTFLLKTFGLTTGENEEDLFMDGEDYVARRINEDEKQEIYKLMREAKLSESKMLDGIANLPLAKGRYESLDDVPVGMVGLIIDRIQKRIDNMALAAKADENQAPPENHAS